MPHTFSILFTAVLDGFRSRLSMQIELIALHHQVAVDKQSISRPKLQPSDRWLWVWPGWQDALEFVQPRTVISWQKQRFRDYGRRLSQSGKPGRPAMTQEVCERWGDRMARKTPTINFPVLAPGVPNWKRGWTTCPDISGIRQEKSKMI